MAQNHSFDIVSEVNMQEMDNAVNQAIKEIQQRYDLKASDTEIELNRKENFLVIHTKDDYSLKSSIDILQSKCIKRTIPLKALKYNDIEATSGGRVKQKITILNGIGKEDAKTITKLIKDSKLKVQAQIQDEQVRCTAPKIDDLQQVQTLLNGADLSFAVQFVNYK